MSVRVIDNTDVVVVNGKFTSQLCDNVPDVAELGYRLHPGEELELTWEIEFRYDKKRGIVRMYQDGEYKGGFPEEDAFITSKHFTIKHHNPVEEAKRSKEYKDRLNKLTKEEKDNEEESTD